MDLYFRIGRKTMSKKAIVFAAVLAMGFGMTACERETPSGKASNAAKSAGQTASDAARATGNAVGDAAKATGNALGDAAKATGDWLTGSKDTVVKTAQEKVDALEAKWKALQDKAAPTTDEAKADWQRAKDQMAQILADAKATLVAAKDASDDVWQKDVKPALAAALDKAQKLYDDVAAKFGSK
jgi:hypothetical protein